MTQDHHRPFKAGASDPMVGDATNSECGDAYEDAAERVPVAQPFQPFQHDNYMVQEEYRFGPTIVPSVLHLPSQVLLSSVPNGGPSAYPEAKFHSRNET